MKAKKVMALMLCAAMVTSMSATAAFAAEEKEDAATEESADSTAAEDPTAQFDGLKANEAYEFPMMVKSFQSTYWDAAQEGMKKASVTEDVSQAASPNPTGLEAIAVLIMLTWSAISDSLFGPCGL